MRHIIEDNKTSCKFALDDAPSVLHDTPQDPQKWSNTTDARRNGSPALHGIFVAVGTVTKNPNDVVLIEGYAVGGKDGHRKTDIVRVTLGNGKQWDDKTVKAVKESLKRRLSKKRAILITPDTRQSFEISAADIRDELASLRPETVTVDNGAKADEAISVGQWDNKTGNLTLKLGAACAAGSCGPLKIHETKTSTSTAIRTRFPNAVKTIQYV